ncbi:peptidoglycan-binding protein [Dactylosporangium siamense]|uniref:Peptidoglycan-binding protein n=1 Tax=Dactylosporangium siamense TaxID=685454 RepID=A0A919PVB2_9ACTN|nr:peptidoglycan-binding domain-containing protein [Dactylosporangium siamense]GIG49098.1 peptidoglycan-binding protein [Dactylosporangium siamense]
MTRLRAVVITAATALVAAAVAAASIGFGGDPPSPGGAPALATAPVTRVTLTRTQQVNGTLGYGTPVRVSARGNGTITALPVLGTLISRGEALYQVDNRPVSLLYGDHPLYRPIQSGDAGWDVNEVEQNLAALGYAGFTVDTTYTASTATAVRKWQKDHGLTQTGVFEPATAVIATGPVRVATVDAQLGDPANGQMLSYSGTTRVVQIPLDVTYQSMARQGSTATVTLPDGTIVPGTVATVGSVAVAGRLAEDPATIDVTVTVADQTRLGTLDRAPVTVSLVAATVENVLTVPVAALVALTDGATGVQVVAGSTNHYVPVELGMFAGGRVQISGDGITEGTLVGIPT